MCGGRRVSTGPILVGVWRPTIVIPENARKYIRRNRAAHDAGLMNSRIWRGRDLAWNWLPHKSPAGCCSFIRLYGLYVAPLVRGTRGGLRRTCHSAGAWHSRGAYGRLLLKLSSLPSSETQPGFTTAGVLARRSTKTSSGAYWLSLG